MTNSVKAMGQGKAFQYLLEKLPQISDSRIKEGIFAGPQIKDLKKDKNFEALLRGTEKAACEVLNGVADNFLGKHKTPNNRKLLENVLETITNMGCNMSLKLHFLHSQLNFFQTTLEMSVTSIVRDFTKTSPLQKNATKANGVQHCLLTTAGNVKEKLQLHTREKQCKTIQLNCVFSRKFLFILSYYNKMEK